MKLGRNIGSVTIPKRPLSVGGLLSWARAANKTLQELRDRKVGFTPSRTSGGGGLQLRSLQASFRYDSDAGEWLLLYVPGFVNVSSASGQGNITPQIDSTDIDYDPAPELVVANGDSIYVKVVALYATPASATVTIEVASSPTSSTTSTGFTAYFPLGTFSVSGSAGTLDQWDGGNLYCVAWGASIYFWSV
jgi:hypothetical protein